MSNPVQGPPPLTEAQKNKVISHLRNRAPSFVCPACRQNNFSVAEHLVAPTVMGPNGEMFLGGASYPMVQVVCTNCYHVLPFMAMPIGILPTDGGGGG